MFRTMAMTSRGRVRSRSSRSIHTTAMIRKIMLRIDGFTRIRRKWSIAEPPMCRGRGLEASHPPGRTPLNWYHCFTIGHLTLSCYERYDSFLLCLQGVTFCPGNRIPLFTQAVGLSGLGRYYLPVL